MKNGRQYAVAVEGTTITFECQHAGHVYKINYGRKRLALHRRLSESACRMYASWWSREKGGCIGECPKCKTKETTP